MGILQNIKSRIIGTETRATLPASFSPYLSLAGGGVNLTPQTDAGVAVTPLRAMQTAAVWACVRTIAETIATLPFAVYKSTDDGVKVRDRTHPIHTLIYSTPNEFMTSFTLRDQLLTQLLLHGNAYAVIERGLDYRPIAILPLESPSVTVRRIGGRLIYITQQGDIIPAEDMIHVLGFTLDGINGISPIMQQKASVGESIATQQFGSKFFANGAHLNGLFERTGNLSPEAVKDFKAQWQEFHSGISTSHGTPMLPAGVIYKALTIPPEQAQFLESRKYQRQDIAVIFRCPPYVVGDNSASTFSNLESQGRQLVQHTLASWIARIEAEFTRKLFREDEQGTYSVKLNVDGLQRGDIAARQGYYANGRQWGYLSVNDIRHLEDLEPIDNGDIYLEPANMAAAGSTPALEPTPKPTPGEPTPPPASRALPDPRPFLEDAARRLLTKEAKALTRAAKKFQGKPEEMRAWAGTWYDTHESLVAKVMAPALRSAGLKTDPTAYAKTHVTESRAAITQAIEASADITDVTDDFVDIRPGACADAMLEGTR